MKSVLTRTLDLLYKLPGLYTRCDNITRRLCNQALFEKIYLEDDHRLRAENSRPLSLLLDPNVQAGALALGQGSQGGRKEDDQDSNPSRFCIARACSFLSKVSGIASA